MSTEAEIYSESFATRSVWRRSATRSPRSDLLGNAFACFVAMLAFVEVKIVGRLFLTEIVLLCMLPFLLMLRGRLLFAALPKKLLLLGVAWLLAQMLTDVIRGTPFEDWSRGWAKIGFLLFNFSAIYLFFYGKEKRFILFGVGIASGQILAYFLNPNIFVEGNPWKWGYGGAITVLAVLSSQLKVFTGQKFLSPTILLGVGTLNFYMGYRSLGLMCLLTAVFLLAKQSNRFSLKKMKLSKVAMLIFLGGVAIYGITALYGYGASEGWLGTEESDKYLTQSSGDLGVLLGGRMESLASVQAIIDSPIIGHGSWAKDWKYVDILRANVVQRGYQDPGESEMEMGLIPSHSFILGAWVESGFVGAIFWFWALVLTARALIATYGTKSALTPLIAFVAFNLLWNIPFSPFGAEARFYFPYYLVLMIYALTLSRSSMAIKEPT